MTWRIASGRWLHTTLSRGGCRLAGWFADSAMAMRCPVKLEDSGGPRYRTVVERYVDVLCDLMSLKLDETIACAILKRNLLTHGSSFDLVPDQFDLSHGCYLYHVVREALPLGRALRCSSRPSKARCRRSRESWRRAAALRH